MQRQPTRLRRTTEDARELVARRRLHEVLEDPEVAGLDGRVDRRSSRHEDERHVGVVGAHEVEHVDAGGAREVQVGEDHVERTLLHEVDRGRGAAHVHDVVPFGLDDTDETSRELRVVLDQENCALVGG